VDLSASARCYRPRRFFFTLRFAHRRETSFKGEATVERPHCSKLVKLNLSDERLDDDRVGWELSVTCHAANAIH
jgi:hypothetical protein